MSEAYKRQHIVPQAYLNRFAARRGNSYQIGVGLKTTSSQGLKMFTNSVQSVAYIEEYYDTQVQKDKKFWEHYLDKNFDSLCGTPLSNIIAKITLCPHNEAVLSEQDKDILSRIIISQAFRVPQFLNEQTDRAQEWLASYQKAILDGIPEVEEYRRMRALINGMSFGIDERKDMVLTAVFKEERFFKYCDIIKQKDWLIFYNDIRNKMPYVTGDNPVVFTTLKAAFEKMTTTGLANDDTVILYPLTPSILIGIYSPLVYFGGLHRYNGRRLHIDDMKFIAKINCLIAQQSYVHTFLPEPLFSILHNRTD